MIEKCCQPSQYLDGADDQLISGSFLIECEAQAMSPKPAGIHLERTHTHARTEKRERGGGRTQQQYS